jgi:RNA polymerase sigma-70 factor (ECF subfamily)
MADPTPPLAPCLLQALGPTTRQLLAEDEPALEATLEQLMTRSQEAWPGVSLCAEEFLPFLAARLDGAQDPLHALAGLHVSDLYLACACLKGDAEAAAQLQATHFPRIETALRRVDPGSTLTDDIKQMVYLKVFAPTEGGQPRITQYSGKGELGKWLQVVAVRVAQNVQRRLAKEQHLHDSSLERIVSPEESPELRYIKQLYRDEFRQAFREALATLTSRQRNVLRYRLVEGLSLEQLAALYKVNRTTITRWIAATRQQLLDETRKALSGALKLDTAELTSLIGVLQSQVETSVRRFLRTEKTDR